jgi:hypothetical protein
MNAEGTDPLAKQIFALGLITILLVFTLMSGITQDLYNEQLSEVIEEEEIEKEPVSSTNYVVDYRFFNKFILVIPEEHFGNFLHYDEYEVEPLYCFVRLNYLIYMNSDDSKLGEGFVRDTGPDNCLYLDLVSARFLTTDSDWNGDHVSLYLKSIVTKTSETFQFEPEIDIENFYASVSISYRMMTNNGVKEITHEFNIQHHETNSSRFWLYVGNSLDNILDDDEVQKFRSEYDTLLLPGFSVEYKTYSVISYS